MILLTQKQLKEIQNHGEMAYPEECCGAMLGIRNEKSEKITKEIIRIENNWIDTPNSSIETRHRRFAITSEDYKFLEAEAKRKSLTLLGFYHTHPDHPAEPSGTDLQYAWPFFSYIIQAIDKGKYSVINSFELDMDKNIFSKEELQIID